MCNKIFLKLVSCMTSYGKILCRAGQATELFSELTKVTEYYCGRTSAHATSMPVLLTVHTRNNSTPSLSICMEYSPAHD